jgi:hypothetical protein
VDERKHLQRRKYAGTDFAHLDWSAYRKANLSIIAIRDAGDKLDDAERRTGLAVTFCFPPRHTE